MLCSPISSNTLKKPSLPPLSSFNIPIQRSLCYEEEDRSGILTEKEKVSPVTNFWNDLHKFPEKIEQQKMKGGKPAEIIAEILEYAGRQTWKILAHVYTNRIKARKIPQK